MDGKDQMAVLRDYQVHPVKRKLLHADFLRVSPESVLVVSVPVKLTGKSLGEKAGGKLLHATRELKLRCAVSVIPEYIEIDVTEYEAGQMLYSKDMVFAEGIEPAFRGNFPIFSVAMPRGTQLLDEEEGEAAETEEA
jgi:large subunit ribosomal protein L25